MARFFKDAPWPVILLIASFLCPTELSLYAGGARLPPHRALLLVLLPLAIMRVLGPARVRVRGYDVLFFLGSVWTIVVYVVNHGPGDGLQTGGALALDSFGSYLVARAYVRDERTFAATAGVLLAAVFFAGLIALPEVVTGKFFVHDFLRQVTGYVHPVNPERRLGLTRAYGTFDHPIHLGTFCGSGLALAIYAARRQSAVLARASVMVAATFMGLSSAPILGLALQAGLMTLDRLTRGVKNRVWIGLALVAVLFAVASLVATRSPFAIIATGFTLDATTGFYRLLIWQFGLDNVWGNPWFGIGLHEWERPAYMVAATVDAFWLVIAMKGGIPAFLLLVAPILVIARTVATRQREARPALRTLARGWQISLAALLLVGCTVHYWNVPYAYFFFFLGLGGCFADPVAARRRARQSKPAPANAERVRWIDPPAVPSPAESWPPAMPTWPVPVVATLGH